MRLRTLGVAAVCAAVVVSLTITWPAAAGTSASPPASAVPPSARGGEPSKLALKIARQVLPRNDGWAASGAGTTGGAAADDSQIFIARNRSELVAALGGDNDANRSNATPKIVFVQGALEANVDDANQPLSCADYADPEYSVEAFLATYDPAVWGTDDPSGPLEDARVRSTRNQRERIFINVGSNTTIIGLGSAVMHGFNLNLQNVSNVIIRNIHFQDAADCFPEWSPSDGSAGNWNSLYDTVTLSGATNVWVDHNTFSDGTNLDANQPVHFGRPYQVHDGSLDIIRASNFVTVSYNDFHDHDKTMLIGSSNTVGADVDKLKVTIHHNKFAGNGQRLPRVRFGQVDVYNNLYVVTDEETFQYAWGVGVFSSIYAENNFVILGGAVPVDGFVFDWRGTAPGAMSESGSFLLGQGRFGPVNFLAEFNATHDPDIPTDAGWTPTFRRAPAAPATWVPLLVLAAGSGKLPT
jgi:pectate lyase